MGALRPGPRAPPAWPRPRGGRRGRAHCWEPVEVGAAGKGRREAPPGEGAPGGRGACRAWGWARSRARARAAGPRGALAAAAALCTPGAGRGRVASAAPKAPFVRPRREECAPGALFGRERSPFPALGLAAAPVPSRAPDWAGTAAPCCPSAWGTVVLWGGGREGGASPSTLELAKHPEPSAESPDPRSWAEGRREGVANRREAVGSGGFRVCETSVGLASTPLGKFKFGGYAPGPHGWRCGVPGHPAPNRFHPAAPGRTQGPAGCSPLVGATMGQRRQGWEPPARSGSQCPVGLTPSSVCPLPALQVSFIRLRIFAARRSTEICTDLLVRGEWNSPHPPISRHPFLPTVLRAFVFRSTATVATILNFYHLLAFIVSWSSQPFGSRKPPAHPLPPAPLSRLCSLLSRFDGKKTSRWANHLGFCIRGGGKFVW